VWSPGQAPAQAVEIASALTMAAEPQQAEADKLIADSRRTGRWASRGRWAVGIAEPKIMRLRPIMDTSGDLLDH
jgi:hypothetical protein